MAEKPRGERGSGRHLEFNEISETAECLNEIDKVLAELLEKGAEWDPQKKRDKREYILELLKSIGINGFADYEGLERAHERARSSDWYFRFTRSVRDAGPANFSDPKGYFAELGVNPQDIAGKTEAEIKMLLRTNYYKLVWQFHPDRNPGDKEAERKMKEITVAYGVLSDPAKRAEYLRS